MIVGLHRRHAHVQCGGDLGVRATRADGERDLALAVGQRGEPFARLLGARGLLAAAGDERDELPRHAG